MGVLCWFIKTVITPLLKLAESSSLTNQEKEEQSHRYVFHEKLMEKSSAGKVCILQVYTYTGKSESFSS